MRTAWIFGGLWAASLVLAWMLGANLREGGGDRRAGRGEGAAPTTVAPPASAPSPTERAEAPRDEATSPPPPTHASRDGETAPVEEAPFSVEGVTTLEELSSRLMAYAARKLAQGEKGQLELYRAVDRLLASDELRPLLRDESQAARLLYPWIRFLMDRERQVVQTMEAVYRKAAEEPKWFEGTDDDTLEMFTEGLAVILPGAVDADALARFRGHVERILAHPQESLPPALAKELRHFQQNLSFWAPARTPEETRARLRDPSVALAAKLEILKRAPPEALAGYDPLEVLLPAVEQGMPEAVSLVGRLPMGPGEIQALDRAFVEAAFRGTRAAQYAQFYLQSTRRGRWADARPLVEEGLRRGGKSTEAFAFALLFLSEPPDAEYVRGLLAQYELPQHVRDSLKHRFKIQ